MAVKAPRMMHVELRVPGGWIAAENEDHQPPQPLSMARNRLRFTPAEASAVRVHFIHDLPARSGVSEIQVWQNLPN
jgi:hypothetical protein